METTVEKLEAMFQKSEADLDYIEKRLKEDFTNSSASEDGAPVEENVVSLLENLAPIKAKHEALCTQVKEITAAHKESMDSIRNHLDGALQLIQQFQETANVEVLPLTESQWDAAGLLGVNVPRNTAEVTDVIQKQQHSCTPTEFQSLSKAVLEAVPGNIRSNVQLAELNAFYLQLHQHFSKTNSGSRHLQEMNFKASDAELKILQHLSLVELDDKDHVRLLTLDDKVRPTNCSK